MYPNLELLMFQNKISRQEMAETLCVTYNSLLGKLNGKQPLKLDEAFTIQERYFPDKSLEFLFSKMQKSA